MQTAYVGLIILRPVEGSGDDSEILGGPVHLMADSLEEATQKIEYDVPLNYRGTRAQIDILVRAF